MKHNEDHFLKNFLNHIRTSVVNSSRCDKEKSIRSDLLYFRIWIASTYEVFILKDFQTNISFTKLIAHSFCSSVMWAEDLRL